jgi:NADPH:quinone reductase-like Zn-dependent oxidoreductase
MKAVRYESYGGYEENRVVDMPRPLPAPGEVLLEMRAVGINPLDNTFREGHHPAANASNLPRVGGQSGVGVVVDVNRASLRSGDRVIVSTGAYGRTADGTWRQFMAVPADDLLKVPDGVDDNVAAAFVAGAGYLTAYLALTEFAKFRPGQSILAPGIGGAVGMESVQIARRLGASRTLSTASTTQKAAQARAAGYDDVVDLSRESLRDGVKRLTEGKGVDVVIDGIGAPVFSDALASLASGGMLISVGYAGGTQVQMDVTELIWRGASVRGFLLRPEFFSASIVRAAQLACLGYLAEGSIKPAIARIFPMTEAAAAVRYLIEGRPFGRVLMTP